MSLRNENPSTATAPPPLALSGLARAVGVLDFGDSVLLCLDRRGRVMFASRDAGALFGCSRARIEGQPWQRILRETEPGRLCADQERLTRAQSPNVVKLAAGRLLGQRGDDGEFPLEGSMSHFRLGSDDCYVLLLHDIGARLDTEARLRHLAQHDSLTGLANRALFMERLDDAIRRHRRAGTSFALLFIDLDGFKQTNDFFGHQEGDRLLKACAERLRACVRNCDNAARLGGDEFAAILDQPTDVSDALETARRIGQRLSQEPVVLAAHAVQLHASVGVAVYPQQGTDAAGLLQQADRSMYLEKRRRAGNRDETRGTSERDRRR